MAGDWLKFDASTPEKPEVLSITVAMGWDDPDLTVGKLLRVWRWFDQQTVSGSAHGVTTALLDRLIGAPGMCDAMAKVGWLSIDSDGISLPNFDRHNGKTAKDRVMTAKRVAAHKANAKGNAHIVTDALPREEKSREEVNKPLPVGKVSRASATRLPADWAMTDVDRDFCRQERPDLNPESVADRFRDYWASVPGAKGRKLDWAATWRNWVRNEKRGADHGKNGSGRANGVAGTIAELTGANRQDARVVEGTAIRVG